MTKRRFLTMKAEIQLIILAESLTLQLNSVPYMSGTWYAFKSVI